MSNSIRSNQKELE